MKTTIATLVLAMMMTIASAAHAQLAQTFYSGASCLPNVEYVTNSLHRKWGQLYNSSSGLTAVDCPVAGVPETNFTPSVEYAYFYLADSVNTTSCYFDGTTAGRGGVISGKQMAGGVGYRVLAWNNPFGTTPTSYLGIELVCLLGGNESSIQGWYFQ